MMRRLGTWILLSILAAAPCLALAQETVNLRASDVIQKAEVSFSPSSGTFQENSEFDVPIYLNTRGASVNAVELHIKYDPHKLRITKPSSGSSIIGYWIGAPSYNNSAGTADIAGSIPNGITTQSGLILTITFQAIASGQSAVTISDTSRVLLNDGLGSPAQLVTNRGIYTAIPKPPDGVQVYSETHQFQDQWYNNANPVLTWTKDEGVSGFSIAIDTTPTTVPPPIVNKEDMTQAYDKLGDGIWYFHIRALKRGVWGAATHYALHIDTSPPAEFKPTAEYIASSGAGRFLVSYFSTDSLSGIDHYELGVIDKSAPATESPVFVHADSPYQFPLDSAAGARVIVRAFDRAGNVRDESLAIAVPVPWLKFFNDNATLFLLMLLLAVMMIIILHFFFGHHVIPRLERAWTVIRDDDAPAPAPRVKVQAQLVSEPPAYVHLPNERGIAVPPLRPVMGFAAQHEPGAPTTTIDVDAFLGS
jgi:hypothetical protein